MSDLFVVMRHFFLIVVLNCFAKMALLANVPMLPALPVCNVNISGPAQICPGGSGTLTATAGFDTYVWSSGDNGNPINITQGGTYTVTATDAVGCVATATYNVGLISVPAPQVGAPPILCSGGISVVAVTPNPAYVAYEWSNGNTQIANYVTTPGLYTVTITTNQGCTTTASGTVNFSGNSIPNATYNIAPSACSPPPVTLSTSSFPPALFVAWSDEDLTQILAISNSYVATQPGIYVAIRTYINACVDTVQIPVGNGIPPVPIITGPTSLCPGQTATLSVQSGFTSYLWSGSASGTQPDLDINGPGTYTVVVRQGVCSGTATRVVTASGNASVSISNGPYQCDGQLVLNASPGFANYSWSSGDNNSSITVTQAGTYSVTVTTASGCTGSTTINASIPVPPVVTVDGPALLCSGQPATLTASAGLTNYVWSSGQNGRIINIVNPGTYTVTAADAQGCTATAAISVGSGTAPMVGIAGPPALCNGVAGTLSATTGLDQYQWSTGSGADEITITNSGTYTVTVTNLEGCTASATYIVGNLPNPVPVIQQAPYQCDGTMTLTIGGGFIDYIWSDGQSDPSITVSSSGIYTVTVTNAAGCTGTAQRNVAIPTIPVVEISGPSALCAGANATFQATPGFSSYHWSTGSNTANILVSQADTYTVTITNAGGCTATAEQNIMSNSADPVFISGPTAICSGTPTTISASASFVSYIWSTNAQGPEIIVTNGGTYRVTATDGNGCTTTDTYTIANILAPTPVIQALPYNCNGVQVLTVSGIASGFVWSNGGMGTQISVNTNGQYTVTATNANGCSGTAVQAVSIPSLSQVAINGPVQLCSGTTGILSASSGFASYNWSEGSIGSSISVNDPGLYGVTVSDANNCTATATFFLNVVASPVVGIGGNTTLCAGSATTLNATPGFANYQWSSGQTTAAISVATAGTFTVTVTNTAACTSTSSVSVTVSNVLTPVIQALPYTCNSLLRLTVPGSFNSYSWNTGATGSQLTINASGTYSVTVTAVGGCSGTGTIDAVIPPVPTISVAGDDDICVGQSTLLSATAGFSVYKWSTGASTSAITASASGVYTVTATDAFGCSTFVPVIVRVLPPPSANIQGNPIICLGQSTTLQAPTGLTSYQWSNNATTRQVEILVPTTLGLTVTDNNGCSNTAAVTTTSALPPTPVLQIKPYDCDGKVEMETTTTFPGYQWSNAATTATASIDSTGVYSVTVTDGNGCTGTATQLVTVPPTPVVAISGPTAVCAGATALWRATAGFVGYQWSNGETTADLSVQNSGMYTVTATDVSGCTTTASYILIVNGLPDAQISGKTVICEGGSTLISAPAGLGSYLWSNGDTTVQVNVSTPSTLGLTVTDANGCSNSGSATIGAADPLQPEITLAPYNCTGTLELSINGIFATYLWSSGATTSGASATASGTYTVTVSDLDGCTGTAIQLVTVPPAPVVAISGPTAVCMGATALWQATAGFVGYQWSNGETTADLSVQNSGMYTVTATDVSGCTVTASYSLFVNGLPDAQISGKTVFCDGNSTLINAPAGLGSYLWSNGATTAQVNVSTPGTIGLTVTDANGCSNSGSVTIGAAAPLQPEIALAPYNCTGTLELSVNGIFATYLWSSGATTSGASATASGTYTVTVSDLDGCTGTATQLVTVPPAPVVAISGPTAVCAGTTALWLATAGFVAYNWSNGQTTPDLSVQNSGMYTVTATDVSGCTAIASYDLIINGLPDAQISGKTVFCDGGSTFVSAPAGLGSYLWSNGATTAQVNVSTPGTIGLTVTDANGCSNSGSVTIGAADPLQPEIALAPYNCTGTLELSVNGMFATYLWSSGATTSGASATASGTYTVTVSDLDGCTGTATQLVTVPPAPVVAISGPTAVCAGATALWRATTGFVGYQWSNGETTSDLSVQNSGMYTVTATDVSGCTVVASYALIVNGLPDAQISGKTVFCDGGSTLVSAPAGLGGYLWSNGATTAQVNVSMPGTIGLTVTDAQGCSNSSTVSIVAASPLQPTISLAPYNCNGVRDLSVNGSFATYVWSNGATVNITSVSNSGTYTVTVSDTNGCTELVSTNVAIPPAPVVAIKGPSQLCTGSLVELQATTGFFNYSWSNGATTGKIDITTPGTYRLTATDAQGCTTETAFILRAADPVFTNLTVLTCDPTAVGQTRLTFAAYNGCDSVVVTTAVLTPSIPASMDGDTLLCSGDTAFLTLRLASGTADISIQSTAGIQRFNQVGDGFRVPVAPLAATAYTLRLKLTNGCPVSLTDSVVLIQLAQVSAQIETNPACSDQFSGGLTVLAQGGTGPYVLTVDIQKYDVDAQPFSVPLSIGSHTAWITDAKGCKSTSLTTNVADIRPSLKLELGPNVLATLGETVTLRPQQLNFQPFNLRWLSGDSLLCNACPSYTFPAVFPETFVLEAEHASGCAIRDSVQLRLQRSGFYLPNAIAPEGSEDNRYFEVPANAGIQRVEALQIFDRWGNQVFAAASYVPGDRQGRWDGAFQGELAQTGVYMYWLKIQYVDGTSELIAGDLTVVR